MTTETTTKSARGEILMRARIEGISPLLMHKFTDHEAMKATAGTAAIMVGQQELPRDQAAKSLHLAFDGSGTIVVPATHIYRAIIDAGGFHKVGKSKISTQRSSLVPSAVWIEETECPIEPQTWEVDSQPVRIPATGGRIMRHRPRFDAWSIAFTLRIDSRSFAISLVRQLLDDAGRKIGIGDFRPACRGPYGRFIVSEWREE